jgi:phosphohistidine phosphatase SixA
VALFGHEPQLSELLSRLLGVEDAARVTFKKGGAALLDVQGEPRRGGTLLWFLPPRILRELGG